MRTRKQDKAFIQLQKYYLSTKEVKLSPTIEEMRVRVLSAHELLSEFTPKTEVARILAKRYDVSERTIYSDILIAEQLFGNILKMDKEYLRAALQHKYMEALNKAVEAGDYENVEKFGYRLEKVSKLHHADIDEIDLSNRQLTQVIIGSDAETLEAQRAANLSEHAEDAEVIE